MNHQIPIQNLYYLLCYAWDVTDQHNNVKVDVEKCNSIENLMAVILVNSCEHLLKRGLVSEYKYQDQEICGIRGKLNIGETLKRGRFRQGHTICETDELSQNNLINQIINSSLIRLSTLGSINSKIKEKIHTTLRRFPNLKDIHITTRTFDKIKIHRNNRVYTLAINVCKLILQSTIPIQGSYGKYEFIDFTQDEFRMNVIFERFLMNFCKHNCAKDYPEIHREYIDFQLTPFGMMFKEAGDALPTMETDLTLYNPKSGVKKILDAKFYKETLLSKYGGQEKIRRDHLSQIISYVMNQEDRTKPNTLETSGILIYPTITEDYDFSYKYRDTNHTIHVKTVNLNQDWQKIEERIKEIIK